VLDLTQIGENKAVLSEDGKYYTITGQKCGFRMRFCSVFIVFARIEMIKYYRFLSRKNTSDNGISMGEEEHKLGIRASSHDKFSLMKLKFLLKTCYLKEEMVSKLP
jgi:alkylation response protein AidB-like acyl-CoA dehydrogenase